MVPFLTRGPAGDGRDAPPGIPLTRLLGRAAEGGIHLKGLASPRGSSRA